MSPSQGGACRGVYYYYMVGIFQLFVFFHAHLNILISKTNKQVTNTCLHFVSDSLDGNLIGLTGTEPGELSLM